LGELKPLKVAALTGLLRVTIRGIPTSLFNYDKPPKNFDQFYFRTTKQLNLDLCVCERGELYLWPRIKHCVLRKFRQSARQHSSIRTVSFFSIANFRDRKVITQKEVMFQEKVTQTRRRKVNS